MHFSMTQSVLQHTAPDLREWKCQFLFSVYNTQNIVLQTFFDRFNDEKIIIKTDLNS